MIFRMGTKGGGEVGSDESGASETPQSGRRVEGAEDRDGDKGQLSRLRFLTWAVDPSPDFLDGGLAGACPGSADHEAEFRF